ncbi:aminoglycoside phosphotransferase family protein [Alkalilacustris brevis]|uniref:aminoglycoside phosphotransferase family protein n=1 Tax=Alkalilacustris brevis TaxID=2026338 RepID=UPI000E0D42BE|nr:phosphotransferase [Alkalilacustris brevis]
MSGPAPTAPETPRAALIDRFLARAGWADARRAALAGDASNRRYLRLTGPGGARAVLMDAAPERGEDVGPFARFARHLRAQGLSAPAILAEDHEAGLLLLEDLGDALFARVAAAQPELEETLYSAAVDMLAWLHRQPPPPDLPAYDPATMAERAALALDWYLPGLGGHQASPQERTDFAARVAALCARLAPLAPVPALRDFHAENLLWLPERQGHARVGLLDFQDAELAHPAYDLVSLLEDARRDLRKGLAVRMLQRYVETSGSGPEAFGAAFACLGAQRNLRILGVFARLALRDGKPGYIRMMPRVWNHLLGDLAHPELAPLAKQVRRLLPAPSDENLQRIAARCAPPPTP